jgi:hypothetical protein
MSLLDERRHDLPVRALMLRDHVPRVSARLTAFGEKLYMVIDRPVSVRTTSPMAERLGASCLPRLRKDNRTADVCDTQVGQGASPPHSRHWQATM